MATDASLPKPTSESTLVPKPGTTSKLWEYFGLRNDSDDRLSVRFVVETY